MWFVEAIIEILENIVFKKWKDMSLERFILSWKIWCKIWKNLSSLCYDEFSMYCSSYLFWRLSSVTMYVEYDNIWSREADMSMFLSLWEIKKLKHNSLFCITTSLETKFCQWQYIHSDFEIFNCWWCTNIQSFVNHLSWEKCVVIGREQSVASK